MLQIVLNQNIDSGDTSIPINCQVLASTFYIMVEQYQEEEEERKELSKMKKMQERVTKHYLFIMI